MRSGFLGRGIGPTAISRSSAAATPWYRAGGAPAPVAVYQPKGAASLAASYINLANPGVYDAAPGTAPTLAPGGWTFDGSTQYLLVSLQPASDQSWSILVRFSNASGNARCAFGSYISEPRSFIIQPRGNTGADRYYYNGGSLVVAGALASGVMGFAGNTAYLDGVAESGTLAAPSGEIATTQVIGGYWNNAAAAPAISFNGTIPAIAIYASTLDAAQMAAVSAAMAAL